MQFNNILNKFWSNNTNSSFVPDTAADANQQQPGANPQAAPVEPLANGGDLSTNPPARHLQEYQAQAIRTGALALGKAKEAFELVKSAKIPEKIEAFYSQDSEAVAIQRFELQISQDPQNIGLYREYAWFLKDIGRHDEARAIKGRMDERQAMESKLLHQVEQKVLKQKTKIAELKAQNTHNASFAPDTVADANQQQEANPQAMPVPPLANIGKHDEARAIKGRMDEPQAMESKHKLEQKVLKQKTKIAELKQTIHLQAQTIYLQAERLATLEKKFESLEPQFLDLDCIDYSEHTKLRDADLIPLLKKSPYVKLLKLTYCKHITNASLAAIKGLQRLTNLNLSYCQITDAGLEHLAGLTQLTSLNLQYCIELTDAGLEHLAGLTQLTNLDLSMCELTNANGFDLVTINITDTAVRHLAGLTQLTLLHLGGTQLTDAGLKHLSGLTQLTSLDLNRCYKLTDQFTDAGLEHLASLTQLTNLYLCMCEQLTGAGLAHLKGLTQLTNLYLYGCKQLTDAGLEHLAGLTQLTNLYLSGCKQLTDAGLHHLRSLTQLTNLDLSSCENTTDAGLKELSGLTQLTNLELNGSRQLTSNAIRQLEKQIPGLRIRKVW